MDTPGGLSESMRDIIKAILVSEVPIAVFVYPPGARAASAGALIALSANIVAMAPGTNIGAAHPVTIGGGKTSSTMQEKITNDAAAFARSVATQRHRNVKWAEKVVRKSISSTAREAHAEGVIDTVVSDLPSLLRAMDGRTVKTAGGPRTLHTAGVPVVELHPSVRERFLAWISNPNIAYLFMLAGVFGIFFEFQNPGAIFPDVLGGISLIIAAFALQMLPVRMSGLALMALAIVLFVLEVKVPSHGVLSIGAIVSMTIGSIMLIDSPLPFMRVSLGIIIPSVLCTAAFFLVAVGLGVRAQRRPVQTGTAGLVGAPGVVRTPVHRSGSVFVHGEIWNAFSTHPLDAGTEITVVSVHGMKLNVAPRQINPEVES